MMTIDVQFCISYKEYADHACLFVSIPLLTDKWGEECAVSLRCCSAE